jgi:hypothetical protein
MRPAHVGGAAENTGKQTLMALDKSHVFADINDDANDVRQENYFNGVIHTLPDSEDPEVLLGGLLRKYPNPPLFAPF